jgi:hypothetical protein
MLEDVAMEHPIARVGDEGDVHPFVGRATALRGTLCRKGAGS